MRAIDDVLGPLEKHPESRSILRHNLAITIATLNMMRYEPFTDRRNVVRIETTLGAIGVSFEDTEGDLHGPGTIDDMRRLPNDVQAEAKLLGSILIDPPVINDVKLFISGGDDFFNEANGLIYEMMVDLYDQHSTVDLVQLQKLAEDGGTIEAIGGVDYLLEIAGASSVSGLAAQYAHQVKDKSVIRQVMKAAGIVLEDRRKNDS